MKKRVISIIICMAMLLSSVLQVNAAPDLDDVLDTAKQVIAFALSKFQDVKETDWYAEAVGRLNVLKIIDGLPGGIFSPQGEVTRAQFVKMLVQAMEYKKIDSLSFEDLKPFKTSKPHWASVYIETALRNGVIIKSELGDNFYPDVPLTRKDMAMMMFRALELEPSSGTNPFVDLTRANGYFTKLYEEYLIRGVIKSGKVMFEPEGLTTRAQAAVIISRMLEYRADPQSFVEQAAREERWANGTQTPEDVAVKRAEEIAKYKADPNYIMEPIVTLEYNTDPWTYRYFDLYFENKADYPDAAKWQLECVNYKQLNEFEMPRPNGTFVKYSLTNWKPLGSVYKDQVRASSYRLGSDYYTTQAYIKDFKIKTGMHIEFKITVKQGNKSKVIYKTIPVNDITFKG